MWPSADRKSASALRGGRPSATPPARVIPGELAWRLTEALPSHLPVSDKHPIYIALACRDFHQAITLSLQAIAAADGTLAAAHIVDLTAWLDTLSGDAQREHLAALLDVLSRRTVVRTALDPAAPTDVTDEGPLAAYRAVVPALPKLHTTAVPTLNESCDLDGPPYATRVPHTEPPPFKGRTA